jgi:hypothetical protein
MSKTLKTDTYYWKHKEQISQKWKEKYKSDSIFREYKREYTRIYQFTHRVECREYAKKCNLKRRFEIFKDLGTKCIRCGETDWRCLQIDHVNGNGAKERHKFPTNSASYYLHILKQLEEGSKEYQILCANCNWRKRYENNETAKNAF